MHSDDARFCVCRAVFRNAEQLLAGLCRTAGAVSKRRQAVSADYREYEIQEGRVSQKQCLTVVDWGFLGSDVCTKSAYSLRNKFHDAGQEMSGSALMCGTVFCVPGAFIVSSLSHLPLLSRRQWLASSVAVPGLLALTGCASKAGVSAQAAPASSLVVGGLFAGSRSDKGFMEAGWRGLEKAR